MKITEILKKYWFVGIIAIALIVFSCIYIGDTLANQEKTVSTKSIDGKDVVVTVGDEYVTADQLYADMEEDYAASLAFQRYYKAVANAAYETTEDMSTTAANAAQYYIYYYGEDEILDEISSYGYYTIDDFTQYFIDMMKEEQLMKDYIAANQSEFADMLTAFKEEEKPVYVRHVLVSISSVEETTDEDGNTVLVATPTEEEQAKLDEVKSKLTVDNFAEIAAEYSDDTSTAEDGGSLGIVTTEDSSTYVEQFYNGVYATAVGTISEPILSTYGYHFIYVTEVSDEELYASDDFYSYVNTNDTNAMSKAIYIKGNELGVTVNYEELKTELDALLEDGE